MKEDLSRCVGCKVGALNPYCPIHAHPDRYEFSDTDKLWLRHKLQIGPLTSEDIEQVRKADEDRFRRD